MSVYTAKSTITLSCQFRSNGVLYDPDTSISLLVKEPGVDVATYTYAGADITKDSTGSYHMALTPTTVGHWTYVWVSEDATNGHVENGATFEIEPAKSQLIEELK